MSSDPLDITPETRVGALLDAYPLSDSLVVSQERRGFGLARARNTGAAAANGEILLFLDCDMVPEPQWIEAHARWHHVVDDATTLGFRCHVDFDGIDAATILGIADRSDSLMASANQSYTTASRSRRARKGVSSVGMGSVPMALAQSTAHCR